MSNIFIGEKQLKLSITGRNILKESPEGAPKIATPNATRNFYQFSMIFMRKSNRSFQFLAEIFEKFSANPKTSAEPEKLRLAC